MSGIEACGWFLTEKLQCHIQACHDALQTSASSDTE